ncbi:UDP-N-acetylmuramoyl-L-alanine--D-glutamate ligase [Alloscardovia macacae]|nr:UDP-N-acetylmuramoyl-L-alanine--D-glutamate ligase [Alloscardovia macacae]
MKDIMASYLVVGLGVSGQGVVSALTERGDSVQTVDDKKPADYTLADINAESFDFTRFDAVITSPGFKPSTPFVTHAREAGVDVISDVELAWRWHHADVQSWIGITGTNGKTTTTEMTTAIMQHAGSKAAAVGNIGHAITTASVDPQLDTLVAELSSFQLHYTSSLALTCAAITNLADDHLDWHGGFENYAADKAKIYRGVQRAVVYNADDARVVERALAARDAGQAASSAIFVGFTLGAPEEGQVGVEDGWIVDRSALSLGQQDAEGEDVPAVQQRIAPISRFTHLTEPDGTVYPHLLADALCAYCLSRGAGVSAEDAIEALAQFAPSGHRIQTVAETKSAIRFVDDSKATNAHAAAASLSSYPAGRVIWISGGLAKGAEFGDLIAEQKNRMKAAVIIGVDQRPMLEALDAHAPELPRTVIQPADSETTDSAAEPIMRQAVEAAAAYAQPGDVILMAPACASMDQFVSYADRGDQFATYAQEWVAAHGE